MEKRRMYPNEYQAIQKWWEEKVIIKRTPIETFHRMMEEVRELEEALLQLDGTQNKALEAGYELADIFILGLSLASGLGIDIERVMEEKLEINFRKYNPIEAEKHYNNGLKTHQVLKVMKEKWRGKGK